MKKCNDTILLLIVFFTFVGLISCTQSDRQLLEEAGELAKEQPDSALVLLSKIENSYRLEERDKADYWRIRSYAHYRSKRSMTTDSLILYALRYYEMHQDTTHLFESYLLAGAYYQWKLELDSANHALHKGLEIAENMEDSAQTAHFLYKLGMLELDRNNNEKAVEYFKRRISCVPQSYYSYYLIGIFSEGDSVSYYLDKGVELALQSGDTLSAAHYLRNHAALLVKDKAYSDAAKLIRRTGELSDFYKDFGANHHLMTEIFIGMNKLDSAQYYVDKAKNEERKSSFGAYTDINLIGDRNASYALQAIIDTKQDKETDLIPMYRFNDSIISETVRKNKMLLEQIDERNILEQQNLKLLITKQRTRMVFTIVLVLVMLSLVFVYVYTLQRKRKLEEVEERAESLQKLFREALQVKDEKQDNNQLFRKTLLQQLGIIKLVATAPVKQNNGLLHQIIDISNESVSTDSLLNWSDLYSIIDSIYGGFHTKLKEKYGDILIEKEVQLCCLLCAGFSTVEISAVMQQSMQTIYQRKSTIRGKLKMEDKEDILSFLERNS